MSAFTDPLHLDPRFSKRLAWSLVLLHLGALGCLLPLTLSWSAKIGIGLGVLWCGYQTARKHLYFIDHPLYGSVLYNDSVWLLTEKEAIISPNTYVHPQLVVLIVTEQGNNHYLILFPDALDEVTFRRLRVRLRHAFVFK